MMLIPPEIDAERRLAGKYLLHLMPNGLAAGSFCLICDKASVAVWEMLWNGERFTTSSTTPIFGGHEDKYVWCDGRPVENRNG